MVLKTRERAVSAGSRLVIQKGDWIFRPIYDQQPMLYGCGRATEFNTGNHFNVQAADAVAWSTAFVGQRKFHERQDPDERSGFFEGLPWNDNLPCNCGCLSDEPK